MLGMMGDKKNIATIIVGKAKPEIEKVKDVEYDPEMGYDQCCEGMISALQSGDAAKLKSNLKSFVKMVIMEEEREEEENEPTLEV